MKKNIVIGVVGFVILDLYFNLVPVKLINMYFQLATILLFFPLASFITKVAGLGGLRDIGLYFHKGWGRNFLFSFLIGFSFWLIWYGIDLIIGTTEYQGRKQGMQVIMPLMQILVGFFLGSFINGIIVRAYVITLLKDHMKISWVLSISIFIYAFEDFWYAGFSWSNIIFSVILGLSLTYAYYKTGSVWADVGIHFGLNVAYGLFYGLVGNKDSRIFQIEETGRESFLSSVNPFVIPLLMFLFLLWVLKKYESTTFKTNKNEGFPV